MLSGIKRTTIRRLARITAALIIPILHGCASLPGGQVVESAIVVYTAGSKNHTAAAQIPVAAADVFASLVNAIKDKPDIVIENLNDEAFLIEVARGSRSLTGQVTPLGANRSLLYVWVDAGDSGLTGEELAISVVEIVCDDLGVNYELVKY